VATSYRAVLTNWVEGTATVLKNGTGGGAPARDEVSPYVMENAMKLDRLILWRQSSGDVLAVDFDLGANRTIGVAALLGHRPVGSTGLGISSCVVMYATAATGYPPGGGGSWTNVATLTPFSDRDSGVIFAGGNVSARYWRFDLDGVFDAFTLSRFLLGAVDFDLGSLGSPGVTELPHSPVIESRTGGRNPVLSYPGDDRTLTTLRFRGARSAVLAKLEQLRSRKKAFAWIDKNDAFSEQVVPRAEIRVTRMWEEDADTTYDLEMDLERLA
jgi:hypothetical protein